MDEEITIIDSNARNERIKNFFVDNKKKLILAVSIILVIIIGYLSFEKSKERTKIKLANQYNLALIDLNPNNNQLKTRKYWHDFLTETSHLSFNECLLILLGVSPKLSNIIEPTLYKTKLNEIKKLQDKQLSLIFFQRVENHLLRERFRSDKINTDDFIKWALDYKYLRKIENESP